MTLRLAPADHPWLAAPEARAVIAALAAARPDAAPEDAARFVGGCVRNAVMGRPISDLDIATPLAPDAVIAALEAAGVRAVPTGVEHGTVTAVHDGRPVEVTSLRRDVATDGRRAVVAFTEDWAEDAARRDFRCNALYCGSDGTVFDPLGAGLADAQAGRIVFIGAPGDRIAEDFLRILRFYRFHAWYGGGAIDSDGQAACAAAVKGLRGLSAERVWAELKKLLAAPEPGPAIAAMAAAGALEIVLPEAMAFDLLGALVALETAESWAPDPLLRLAALMPRLPDAAQRAARRLKLSNAEAERLTGWAVGTFNPRLLLGRAVEDVGPALYGKDGRAAADRARLAWAIDAASGEVNPSAWRTLLAAIEAWRDPPLPVTGADVMAAGVPKGPQVGAALKALEALWVKGRFTATREALLAALPMLAR